MDRIEFAKNIINASVKINFWRWYCNWPKTVYKHYAEVYNKTKEISSNNKVAFII
jgi:hypothetical protein